MMRASFAADKARVLGQVDLSRKGSVDAAIVPVLACLNAQKCFYSTSSCAGRLVLFAEDRDSRKKGCQWLLVSHDPLDPTHLEEALTRDGPVEEGYVYFKFEPFVLHVMCATLPDAKLLLQVAVGSGFRNSGMSCGKKERWMVAVRSTQSLETPLAHNATMLTSTEYRRHVVTIGNAKLKENMERIERFHHQLKTAIERCNSQESEIETTREKPPHPVREDPSSQPLQHIPDPTDTANELDGDLDTLFSTSDTQQFHYSVKMHK